jgi:microcin C transport system substrate-binding protein
MKTVKLVSLAILSVLLVSCGGESDQSSSLPAADITEEKNAFYAANPDRFRFKTPGDLPADLVWEDGMDLPEIGSPQAVKGGTQYSVITDFPPTLRPYGPDANSAFRAWVYDDIGMMLAHRHPNEFDYFPGILESWAISESDNTVYMKINPQARWSDGEPITADDMLFTMFFGMSEYINDPWQNNYWESEFVHVTKYDELTFAYGVPRVRLDTLGVVMEIFPAPEHFFSELGEDYAERYQWRFTPTAGRYEVQDENITMGSNIALTAIDDWWAKDNKFWQYRFNANRINLAVIRDPAKRFEAFRAGDTDQFEIATAEYWYEFMADTDPDVVNGYIHKAQFFNDGPRSNWGLWINSSRPLLDNQDIRLGIQYASNWDLVIENYFRGDLFRLNTPRDGYGEYTPSDLKARPFDINKALEHFAKAGFTRTGPDGILLNEQGQRLSFTLSTHYDRYTDIFTILKEEAIKAGLDLRIEIMDSASGFRKAQEKQHDIYFVSFNQSLEPLPRFWDYFHSDNAYDQAFLEDGSINPDRKIKPQTNNLESIAISEMDEMIDRFDNSTDENELLELSHAMLQLHYDYGSWVPGFVKPFYWHSYWRWVKWPEEFNYKYTKRPDELMVHWIDTEAKELTQSARRAGETFEPSIAVFDQFKVQ